MSAHSISRKTGIGLTLLSLILVFAWTGNSFAQAQIQDEANSPETITDQAQRAYWSNLKYKAMQRLRNHLAVRLDQTHPKQARVSLFVDVTVDTFILERIDLYIDGYQEPISREYNDNEAASLLRYAMHRIYRSNFQPGSHHIKVEYRGRKRGLGADAPKITGSLELTFNKSEKAQALILPVVPEVLRPKSAIIGQARPELWMLEAEQEDPRLSMVRFQRDQGQAFKAMEELLTIAGPTDDSQPLPSGYYTLLAHVYMDFDMREQAIGAARRATAETEPSDSRIPPGQTLTDAWLRIAESDYEQSDYKRALWALDHAEAQLESMLAAGQQEASLGEILQLRALRLSWQDIKSRVLMAQHDYTGAQQLLADANDSIDKHGHNIYLDYPDSLYIRFNYAVALLRARQNLKAYTLFNRIGEADPETRSIQWLRDQANLTLAYELLRARQGATAKPVFERLPLSGRFSDKALLGLGWSELAPPGEAIAKNAPDTYGGLGDILDFVNNLDQAQMAADSQEKFARAYVPWQELAGRNPAEPAVQEVLVALPYALDQIGQRDKARTAYNKAAERLEKTKNALQTAADILHQGRLGESIFFPDRALGLPDTRWIDDLRAGNLFQSYFDTYQHMQSLTAALDDYGILGSGELRQDMMQAAVTQASAAQTLIAREIDRRTKQTEYYRLEALIGLGDVLSQ